MRLVRFRLLVLAASVTSGVWVAPVGADPAYHTAHIALELVGSAPLRSGFVQNIHANGLSV
jgi:hypothetical protein